MGAVPPLRMWKRRVAHAQIASVFFEKTLGILGQKRSGRLTHCQEDEPPLSEGYMEKCGCHFSINIIGHYELNFRIN